MFSKNRERLLNEEIAESFFRWVLQRAKPYMSDAHFTVDGALIETWASQQELAGGKMARATSREPEGRSIFTERSGRTSPPNRRTDPDARRFKKSKGSEANGRAEREAATARRISGEPAEAQMRGAIVWVDDGKWRSRFMARRLDGLLDEPRPGAPREISDAAVERVLTLTLESTPRDATHWSTRLMARRCGMSQSAVSRIWRAFALQPHRSETFKLSRDPLFVEKVRDIVGLYLHPPDRALVLCVDEKAQIQALNRTQPLLPINGPGRAPHTRLSSATEPRRCLQPVECRDWKGGKCCRFSKRLYDSGH